MDQNIQPSAPPKDGAVPLPTAPPSYDEAVGNVASPNKDQNSAQFADGDSKKKEDQKKQASALDVPVPLVTAQPLPQPQPEMTYNFNQPPQPQPTVTDGCMVCLWCDGDCITDLCYAVFCCSRHVTGHDAGCCDCGDTCCDCPDGCCDCGDCDCGDCDCGDCDCGDCDCDCGDCSIL